MHVLKVSRVFYVSLHGAQTSLGSPPVRLSTKRLKPGLGRSPTAETWRFLLLFIWWEVVCYAKQKIAQTFLGKKKEKGQDLWLFGLWFHTSGDFLLF